MSSSTRNGSTRGFGHRRGAPTALAGALVAALLALAGDASAENGALTQSPGADGCIGEDGDGLVCMDGRALDDPRSVAVSRDGKHVYVASQGSAAVAVLRREK